MDAMIMAAAEEAQRVVNGETPSTPSTPRRSSSGGGSSTGSHFWDVSVNCEPDMDHARTRLYGKKIDGRGVAR